MLRAIIITALLAAPTSAAAEGNAEQGRKVYKKCAACHMIGPSAKNRVGPALNGVVAAPAGQIDDYRYSKGMQRAAADGLTWTAENLDAFLTDPRGSLQGTKMGFRGLRNEQDRADVIAYLASFSKDGGAAIAPVESSFAVAADILALEGDAEYGEYLSGECITCHQASGGSDGIPTIIGWDTTDFVTAMHAYRAKHRNHPVMEMVSARLADDEIAALAAYFKDLKN